MTDGKLLSTITRRQVLRAVALVPLGVLLASCAPASPSTSTNSSTATSTGAAPGSAAPKSTRSAITFPVIAAPGTLNPIKVASTAELQIAETIHGSLVRLDPTNFEPKPHLAESWETSADGLTWTFHLRKGVTFHDGQDCTAEDVKFTMDQMLNPKVDSARGRQFLAITETRVVDPLTVQFTLSSPWAALPTILAGRWAVAPKHILESLDIATDTTFDKKPIGIGPYMLSEWVAGDHLTLTANKAYFLGPPKIDTVIFKVLPDASVQVAQLRTGEVDAIPSFRMPAFPRSRGNLG